MNSNETEIKRKKNEVVFKFASPSANVNGKKVYGISAKESVLTKPRISFVDESTEVEKPRIEETYTETPEKKVTEKVETTPVTPTDATEEAPKKKKKWRLSLTEKKALSGWLFVLPFVIGIIFLYAPIVVNSIMITFSTVTFSDGMVLTWNNFQNYFEVFNSDPYFSITIVDGFKDLILQIPAIVIFALFMAIILNQKMTGRAVFRAIFFLPVILSTGIIDTIDTNSAFLESLENSQGGVDDNTGTEAGGIISALDIEALLGGIKLGSGLVTYVTDLVNNIFDIVSRSGVQMLIFLSGLQSISPAIYESCQVEGASAWETFWKITLPMISPMILVNAIYTVIDAFTAADNRVMVYIEKIYSNSHYGHASTMSWIYVGVVLVFILVVALIMKTVVFYQRRD
ncbi:MAG: sugar ABC transporter permease [Clostridia bacterium]|nr:sugar ABC transporter permease [Clostridia bacterium]